MPLLNRKLSGWICFLSLVAVLIAAPGSRAFSGENVSAKISSSDGQAGHFLSAGKPAQEGKITRPELAARALYEAWRRKNRRDALESASKEAVDTLFANRWMPMKFKGCEPNSAMEGYVCRFYGKNSGVLEMMVEGGASAGYGVQSVSLFSAVD